MKSEPRLESRHCDIGLQTPKQWLKGYSTHMSLIYFIDRKQNYYKETWPRWAFLFSSWYFQSCLLPYSIHLAHSLYIETPKLLMTEEWFWAGEISGPETTLWTTIFEKILRSHRNFLKRFIGWWNGNCAALQAVSNDGLLRPLPRDPLSSQVRGHQGNSWIWQPREGYLNDYLTTNCKHWNHKGKNKVYITYFIKQMKNTQIFNYYSSCVNGFQVHAYLATVWPYAPSRDFWALGNVLNHLPHPHFTEDNSFSERRHSDIPKSLWR